MLKRLIPLLMLWSCAVADEHADLITLFEAWRAFEQPPLLDGAPDYTHAQFESRQAEFEKLRATLNSMEIADWPVGEQVDWHLVRAEMNGYDFNRRVLMPWTRDPAFYNTIWTYRSDVPAHEGPTHHAVVELWQYTFPLSEAEEARLARELSVIPPLFAQAKVNLTGNARDLWITGIRDVRSDIVDLDNIESQLTKSTSEQLRNVIAEARAAAVDLVAWLESQASEKTGPSGIGKENYTWYLQNVHLVPLSWEDEVRLLERELARAWTSLKLEEQRNQDLPPLVAVTNQEEYEARGREAVARIMRFVEEKQMLTVADYMESALLERLGNFVPEETRNFFWITAHLDPAPLYTHFYHWWELARMDIEPHPSPVRQGALLYNIFDSRNEGAATGVEEMFMHAGLYDDSPRSRELVWILLAQRAARGLGSLYAHANEMTMEEAGGVHMEWTPRGWMKTEKELLIFEQHLYLRQPGYGTSYVTGKYLLEQMLAEYAKRREEDGGEFVMAEFFDEMNRIDSIPMSLAQWEMTGVKTDILK
ncbi:MAG: hypothetical protein AAFR07_02240 [Pseudomonadota bacterium]